MRRRMSSQQDLIESASRSLEIQREESWQHWSRAPDVSTALSVLGSGTYSGLPRQVYEAANVDGHGEVSLEEMRHNARRAQQLALLEEEVPPGARLRQHRNGLAELSVPGLFVCFLALRSGGLWQVLAVELLVKGAVAPTLGTPSEAELLTLVQFANSAVEADRSAVKAEGAQGATRPKPLVAIVACLSPLASLVALRALETSMRALTTQWGVRVESAGKKLSVRLWSKNSAAVNPLLEVTAESHTPSAALLYGHHRVNLAFAPDAICASRLLVHASEKSAELRLNETEARLAAVLTVLERSLAYDPSLGVALSRPTPLSLELSLCGQLALTCGCNLRSGAVCVSVPVASRGPHRGLDLRTFERALNEASPSIPQIQLHVVRLLNCSLLNFLASLASAQGLPQAPAWVRSLDNGAAPVEFWPLGNHESSSSVLLEAKCHDAAAHVSLSLRVVATAISRSKRPLLLGHSDDLPAPEFSAPVVKRRRLGAGAPTATIAHFNDALERARRVSNLLAVGADLLAGADWLADLGLELEGGSDLVQRLLSPGGAPLRVKATATDKVSLSASSQGKQEWVLQAGVTDEGTLEWTATACTSVAKNSVAERTVPLLCGSGAVALSSAGHELRVQVPTALGIRNGLACALAAVKCAWHNVESADARISIAASGVETFLDSSVL